MNRRYLVAGNWKMNGSRAANAERVTAIRDALPSLESIDVLVCPPSIYLESVRAQAGRSLLIGAQDLSEQPQPGAYTGEIHGAMLSEVGCRYVIVGHSERRALYGEDDVRVARKFETAQTLGLIPILCLGETLKEREAGRTESVLARQLLAVIERTGVASLARAVIAYEPVWAIGTGRTATCDQAQAAHAFLRSLISEHDAKLCGLVQLLYGGSVKADNASELFACPDVDGGLIGGASLKAAEFLKICESAQSLAQFAAAAAG